MYGFPSYIFKKTKTDFVTDTPTIKGLTLIFAYVKKFTKQATNKRSASTVIFYLFLFSTYIKQKGKTPDSVLIVIHFTNKFFRNLI